MENENTKHHIIPLKIYFIVFGALMALTAFTVLAAKIDLGSFNIILAMLIAIVKSSLVLLFFITHLRLIIAYNKTIK